MADADGNVVYQAINPDIIPALKWIQEAVQKGLIPMECFTNGWSEYLSYYDSYPPLCFMVTAYSNADTTIKHPMDVRRLMDLADPATFEHSQSRAVTPSMFSVYSTLTMSRLTLLRLANSSSSGHSRPLP